MPDTLAPQVPLLLEVLAAAGIATGGAEGYEADDVIGTLAATETTDQVLAVSGDRDLMQIVGDDEPGRCGCSTSGAGWRRPSCSARPRWPRSTGCRSARAGEAYAEMAMLRGDPSDGLPGVPGVGAKTAATLVGRFDSWADLRAAIEDRADNRISATVRTKLVAAAPYLAVVEQVVRVAVDADVHLDRPDTLPTEPADPERLDALAERWGLDSSVERLRAALAR